MTTSPSGRIGAIIGGRYKLEQLLGQGGMSAVYQALDPNLQRQVAVKLIHPHLSTDPEFVTRFETEATAVARLKHPHIYQIHDFNHDNDLYYMVMEYVPGQTLDKKLKDLNRQHQRFNLRDVVRIMSLTCDAVHYAHRHGMIHRDIKPSNIMINEEGEPVLMDFGVAKILGDTAGSQTATGTALGTAAYMSPEQAQGGKVDTRADIYSLGIILYEIVSGERPFTGDSAVTVMMKHIQEPVPDLSQILRPVPTELANIISKALAKDPQDRYATAGEMAQELRAIPLDNLGETSRLPQITSDETIVYNNQEAQTMVAGSSATQANPAAPTPAKSSAIPWLPIAAVVGVILIAALAYIFWPSGTAEELAESTPTSEEEVTETTLNPDLPTSAGMNRISGGDYTVGVPGGGREQIDAKTVTVAEFWLDSTETTNADYLAYLADHPDAAVPTGWSDANTPDGQNNQPVRGLTYDAAEAYCLAQNKRLPTEAEWEAAARGANGRLYPWGNDANQVELPRADSYPVGTVAGNRSPFGVYDMAGNVWEWVSDPYEAVPAGQQVLRGGQYGLVRDMAYRLVGDPNVPSIISTAGVRCAATEVNVLPGDGDIVTISDESIILQDDFTDPNSGWPEQQEDDFFSGYHPPDYYHLQLSTAASSATAFRGVDLTDFTAEVDVFIEAVGGETSDFSYGIALRAQGDNFYSFNISPRTHSWRVYKHTGATKNMLASGVDEAITFKAESDTLRADADGSRLRFSFNGQPLADIRDDSYATGDFGFYIESVDEELMHIHYDELTIRQVDIPADAAVLIDEDFTDPASGWPENSTDTILTGYHPPDYYHVQAGAADTLATAFYPLGQTDFTAEADVFIEAVDTTDGAFRYGLATRRSGDDYYAFTISPRTQEWAVLKHTAANGVEVLTSGTEAQIVFGLESDRLRVDANGSQQIFSMNGVPIAQINDDSLTGNDIGFFVQNFDETRSHIHYETLLVRQFDAASAPQLEETVASVEQTPEPTPEPTAEAEPVGDLPSGVGMVNVPAGTYKVGAGPVLELPLNGFWIDQFEVTNNLYAQYLLVSGGEPPAYWANENIPAEKGEHPVQGLSWEQAAAYCQSLNKRLPSEAEWEAAVRGPNGFLYPWGNEASLVELPDSGTYPVGSILENRSFFGVYDMAANVWEWVDEPYIDTPEGQQVLRGGANNFQNDMTFRVAGDPTSTIMTSNAGMRCAATAVAEEATAAAHVHIHDEFDEVDSGWWQARAPIGPYFYGYHPTDFYHVQVQQDNGCLSVYRPLDADNVLAEIELFTAATTTETGNYRYGLTMREQDNGFYAFVISPRTGSWQVLKNSSAGMLLMAEGTVTTLGGTTQETRDRLTVTANGAEFTFWVNGELISQLVDSEYATGDVGFLVETLDETYVHAHFDSVLVTDLPANVVPSAASATGNYPISTAACGGTVATDDALGSFVTHQVSPNESLTSIAADFGVTIEAILQANGKDISDPSVILPGQTIVIPQES